MTITGETVNLLLSTTLLIGALGAGFAWFRRWIRKQVAEPLSQVQSDVTGTDGTTVMEAVRECNTKIDTLAARFQDHLIAAHQPIPQTRRRIAR